MERIKTKNNTDIGLLILRLTIGILMLFHGISKIFHGIEPITQLLSSHGLPAFIAYGVYIGEVIVPLLIIIGYRTRLMALIFAVNCLVAALLAHAGDIFSMSPHGGWAVELLGLYFFGAIALIFTGAGQIAISSKNRLD